MPGDPTLPGVTRLLLLLVVEENRRPLSPPLPSPSGTLQWGHTGIY